MLPPPHKRAATLCYTNRFAQAQAAAAALTAEQVGELTSFKHPPPGAKVVSQAVAVLFGYPTDWQSAQKLLADHHEPLQEVIIKHSSRQLCRAFCMERTLGQVVAAAALVLGKEDERVQDAC